MENRNRLVLVDGYAHIYRSYYAIRELTNGRDEPVNALYGMARFLMKIDHTLPHDHGAVCMDKGRPKERLELLPSYKGTRPPMPDPLRAQLPLIRDWIVAAGWPIVEEEGREADDLIGAVAKVRDGKETYVVTHDKDLAQLVEQGVWLLLPGKKGESVRLDPSGVTEKFGVPPEAIPDYLALIGDSVDNIPGVSGVGPKTAVALLSQFGSIDAMLEQADAIERASLREKIRQSGDLLRRNMELVGLDLRLPEGWGGLETVRRREPDWEALLSIARDHEFKSLVTALEQARYNARNPSLF
ncbi:MAG: hypothetical protein HN742_41350 [Lentisphaerae bacterium]|jgi:DNA polymerase I|nr:hypothetical protein [Lentisphaerota bacterium]MBT4817481.1 hypothetical protein [Lentisphaerota bacterium]MBT5612736.1 hypothetical protein [Lentisphaerota bacterium]MBT7058965.1 hypothetical protein [Lentisphaerota bacterium]MBT7848385.1 hypothetical protein [Lentisphaerota bacterium]